jgi:hypothetical protein
MWLINCSNYRLEYNNLDGPASKPYWILSHTWGEEEVTFQDMQDLNLASRKKGFRKIEGMCKLASTRGCNHVWIDTCCIDKSSSAELSESINSMFYWYKKAERCIAFLEDLEPGVSIATENALRNCRWFKRGWTLQELIAPTRVDFYDCRWDPRGTKRELCFELCSITGIDNDLLLHPWIPYDDKLHRIPVATRMSWAAGRQTTRIEDKAYCLLGIFDVHMPLLYGERDQAFRRLQQAIAQKVNDMSLFAWVAESNQALLPPPAQYSGLLASDPSQFVACASVVHIHDPLLPSPSWTIANAGIEMTTALDCGEETDHTTITADAHGVVRTDDGSVDSFCYRLFLHCHLRTQPSEGIAILVRKTSSGFIRFKPTEICSVKRSGMEFDDPCPIRVSLFLTEQQRDYALLSVPSRPSFSSAPNSLCIHWSVICCDSRVTFEYHPNHLWDRGQLWFPHTSFATALREDLAIGLVEVTISSGADSESFSSTCWIFCGVARHGWRPRPWIQLAREEADGSVPVFGGRRYHRRQLTNPYALSSLVLELNQEGLRPDLNAPPGVCILEGTGTNHFRLSASEYKVLGPTWEGQGAYHVTIRVEQFDPTHARSLEPSPGGLPHLGSLIPSV